MALQKLPIKAIRPMLSVVVFIAEVAEKDPIVVQMLPEAVAIQEVEVVEVSLSKVLLLKRRLVNDACTLTGHLFLLRFFLSYCYIDFGVSKFFIFSTSNLLAWCSFGLFFH